jgi:hypothetical protein
VNSFLKILTEPEMLEAQEQNLVAQGGSQVFSRMIPLFWLTLIPVVIFLIRSSKARKNE